MDLRIGMLAIASGLASASLPSAASDYSSLDCNANGYVLQPDTRPRARETIYLGKDCDAYSDAYHSGGSWCWTNAGLLVNYDIGQTFTMRIELPVCPALGTSSAPCMCS